MLVTFGICFKQHFDTRYLVFYNPSPPRMFLSLDLLSDYQIQHGAIRPLYVTSSYSTWIFRRGVSGFATDCPWDVWCRGLTTCLLHVGPPFGNRFLNTSWAVGLTYWIVYLHFFCILTYAIIYVLIHQIIFWLYLYFLNILYFFKYSCTKIFHRHSLCTFYWERWSLYWDGGPHIHNEMFGRAETIHWHSGIPPIQRLRYISRYALRKIRYDTVLTLIKVRNEHEIPQITTSIFQ